MQIYNSLKPLPFIIVLVLLASLLIGCGLGDTKDKYKITVNIDVDGKTYSGSGVQEFGYHKQSVGIVDTDRYLLKGEAIPINLGKCGYVFMILDTPQYYIPKLKNANAGSLKTKWIKPASWEINLDDPPLMVKFEDIKDPKTVKAVYFSEHEEFDHYETRIIGNNTTKQDTITKIVPPNAEDLLCRGIVLKSIHVEKTNEWVTFGRMEKILPWLKSMGYHFLVDYGGVGSHGSSGSHNLTERLLYNNFIWR